MDGFGAAWAAHLKLGDDGVCYLPVLYHEPVPEMEPDSEVYLVDFCYSSEVIVSLTEKHRRVTIIDHHKTASQAIANLTVATRVGPWDESATEWHCINGIPRLDATFNLDHSGAVLTWKEFHSEPVPLLLQYVEDRGLWRWKLPHSKEVSAYLASMPQDFKTWSDIAATLEDASGLGPRLPALPSASYLESALVRWHAGLHPFISDGAAILRTQAKTVESAVKRARWAVLGGHRRIPIVNATVHGSETGEALCLAHPAAPFAAYYFDTGDGKRGWGLRSRGGFDVSEVAKKYGGGGHPAAAGFTTGLEFYGDEHGHSEPGDEYDCPICKLRCIRVPDGWDDFEPVPSAICTKCERLVCAYCFPNRLTISTEQAICNACQNSEPLETK